MCAECISRGIPKYLISNGRSNIQVTLNDIFLRRVSPLHFEKDQVSLVAFPLKNDSYNLNSLCKDQNDVLYNIKLEGEHYLDHGIIGVSLKNLWNFGFEYQSDGKTNKCTFSFHHCPEECMYPHAEIRVYLNGNLHNPVSSKTAKNALRLAIVENYKILKFPTI